MFCYQCEQTARGTGCNVVGVCGKSAEVSDLQDLLVHAAKGIAMYAHRARGLGSVDREIDRFVVEALFTTVTNVNFDNLRMAEMIARASSARRSAKRLYEEACARVGTKPEVLSGPAVDELPESMADMVVAGGRYTPLSWAERRGDVVQGLYDLVLLGLKGSAAYAHHALVLGYEDEGIYGFFHEKLDALSREAMTVEELTAHVLDAGKWNIDVMNLLDRANTEVYGHPEPTPVRIHPLKGKAILVSGHDLRDLDLLLQQTEGKGINIYTHGEMLPCHGYPRLKKYPHLAGNYGGAWQDQQKEFAAFPGAILMTTNCIQKPTSYTDRIFTTGLVAFPGVRHIDDKKDFTPVIEAALAAPGFEADGDDKRILVGFGHNTVLNAAGKVVELVKAGKIRHFFLVGGCDGAKSGRNYYTDFATQAPRDTVILTLACGKFRFNKLDFGDIDGLPRLLDVGQCNDAASAIKIAAALAEAFGTDVNGLPLSLVLSWYEQKAVCILLSLLFLGIKNIRLGPSLPAFVKPPVLEFLQKAFNIQPITTPEADLKAILG
ncbi:hydroxylamine reductase [Fretibacterium sp. OH1220_COT-178]|uniref:hydroxylamine reductase n=1 Tax=Fretibacterium sp. OH1220_COT-178 TaxID=2491047 RepID=UPI000F5E0DBD|nr:hydroxylamine reductase [Fretibacterium sp. OH1220_COT-178]RRD64772.1 hydroxylamine reductase [Fretibacterium sp. OH1220_COT-178]